MVDKEKQTFEEVRNTKLIVIAHDPESNFMQVRFDGPGDFHPRKDVADRSSTVVYYKHYFDKATLLTGGATPTALNSSPHSYILADSLITSELF